VFTHHTQYEKYTHYVPGSSPTMQRFAVELSTGYCNLCDAVIAPSESIAAMLREQGVTTPVEVVPTGVDVAHFARGDGAAARRELGIDAGAFVVGHVGRLAPEKNLGFLAAAVARFLRARSDAHFLVVGAGPSEAELRARCAEQGAADRLHLAGSLSGSKLADAYAAADVFAFASQSETQGMVLTEAMAAGLAVVAVDANGVREVVRDGENGRLLAREDVEAFAAALDWIATRSTAERAALVAQARATAERFSLAHCADRALALYDRLIDRGYVPHEIQSSPWQATLRWLDKEWQLIATVAGAVGATVTHAVRGDDPQA
jgi:glycosyltransferase involved in cell wall biosynthesis